MEIEKYVINPSELSYKCDHCAHLKHNYELEDRGILGIHILHSFFYEQKKLKNVIKEK